VLSQLFQLLIIYWDFEVYDFYSFNTAISIKIANDG